MVVLLVHADLHQDHVISQLRHVMSTSILVQPANTTGGSSLCSVTHQRKSGKVLRKVSWPHLGMCISQRTLDQ